MSASHEVEIASVLGWLSAYCQHVMTLLDAEASTRTYTELDLESDMSFPELQGCSGLSPDALHTRHAAITGKHRLIITWYGKYNPPCIRWVL